MHALIIEDDPSVSRSIALLLTSRGHTCDAADTGAVGIEHAGDNSHDIILLDLSLPDMDGHSVLRQLQTRRIRTPVLILSGSDDRRDKIEGLGIGADDYVTKPFDSDELLARIGAIIRRVTGRTPPKKAVNLDSVLLAKRGQSAAWNFNESYTPPTANDLPVAAASPIAPTPRIKLGPAKVIVLGNGKGGTGKSTLAMHLIAAFLVSGRRVASFDCDCPQGTLSRYIENRRRFAAQHPSSVLAMPRHETLDPDANQDGRADRALEQESGNNDVVIIDTPGHDTPLSRWAHGHADILVTPINDSFIDLDVLAEISDEPSPLVRSSHYSKQVQDARLGKPSDRPNLDWLVVRNRLASPNAKNRQRMAQALSKLCDTLDFREGPGLRERVIYRELFLSGLTLLDLPRDDVRLPFAMSHVAARQELRQLLEAIQAPDTAAAVAH